MDEASGLGHTSWLSIHVYFVTNGVRCVSSVMQLIRFSLEVHCLMRVAARAATIAAEATFIAVMAYD